MKLDSALLPGCVKVDGVYYPVHTDFAFWLRFYSIIKDGEEHPVGDFDFLYSDGAPEDRLKGFEKLKSFFSPENPLPRPGEPSPDIRYFDYIIDSDLIYAAFFEQYGIDLLQEGLHMHWHKFLALFNGLHGTKFNDIVSYRAFRKGEKASYENKMESLKKQWEITADTGLEMTEEEKEFFDSF